MEIKQFEQYFKVLYVPLGMYALRIVGNVEDAEDVVSEAFSSAWQALSRGATIDNFKAFMYRSVYNGGVSLLRGRKEFVSEEEIPEVCDETVDTSERDAAIWLAVNDLPEKCREIFLMSKRDGLSNDEIASELNISVSTVKNQISKAYSRLRSALRSGHKPFFLPFL